MYLIFWQILYRISVIHRSLYPTNKIIVKRIPRFAIWNFKRCYISGIYHDEHLFCKIVRYSTFSILYPLYQSKANTLSQSVRLMRTYPNSLEISFPPQLCQTWPLIVWFIVLLLDIVMQPNNSVHCGLNELILVFNCVSRGQVLVIKVYYDCAGLIEVNEAT